MSVIVTVTVEGVEKLYFKISSYAGTLYVERPDRASIHVPKLSEIEDLETQVTTAIEAIKEEDDKWATLNATPLGIEFPKLSDLDS